jgi:glycosyltransferase involved in cell wall biosynthesis
MIKIVYINTTGHMSGAAVSMSETVRSLKDRIQPVLLTPRGSATGFLRQVIDEVAEVPWLSQFDHTRYGRYRGARWLIALREMVLMPVTVFSVWRVAKRITFADVIHLNEITGIIPAILLKRFLGAPLIVHVRANMGDQSRGIRSKLLWNLIRRHADQVICIDETVRSSLPRDIPAQVIHNSLNVARFERGAISTAGALDCVAGDGSIHVGIVGSIIRVKGVFEFTEAAISICRKRTDIRFFLVGAGLRKLGGLKGAILGMLGLAEDAEALIARSILESGMTDRIVMSGHLSNLAAVYSSLDILCFPSHYDAPGRPIFEAALFGRPSIVAIDNPLPDTLIDGVTGIAIPARNCLALEQAILNLADNRALRDRMGEAARALASAVCDPTKNAAEVAEIYSRVIALSKGNTRTATSGKRTGALR